MRTTDELAKLVSDGLAAAQAAGKLPPSGDAGILIEKPKLPEHGDFSTSVSLTLARAMRMAPMAIAEQIVNAMSGSPLVGRAWVAPPGFINFSLSEDWLRSQVNVIRDSGDSYGGLNAGAGQKVQVEFVSVNPTGPLHVGHARGAVIGSGIANVLEAAGYEVQREYYVNDAGNQMRVFYDTLYARYMQAAGHDVPLPEPAYPGEYLQELASDLLRDLGAEHVSRPREEAIAALAPEALRRTLADIRSVLADLRVEYDEWFSEQTLLDTGQFEAALKLLEERGFIVNREGARWFLSSQLGEEKDNVVIRSGEGGPTYFGTDIAYHYNKFSTRKFDRVINVWGADHHGHVSRMKTVVKALGFDPDRLVVILNQIVNFKDGGETVRFSKRRGVIVTVRELVDEVGADACRYIFLSRSPDSQMEFDLDLAKKQSSENPVYYVQYAHARLCSILRTASDRGIGYAEGDVSLLEHPRELDLLRRLIELPDVVLRAAERLEPHHLPHYAAELSRALQRFYEECRVVSSDDADLPVTMARLRLVEAARIVLARTLGIMGMTAPEQM